MPDTHEKTHFGYQQVDATEKAGRVRGVFDSVASRYDLMNDLMSGGLHRLWKHFTVGQAALRPGMKVLDLATGSGDLARAMAKKPGVDVWMTDINAAMLAVGRDRALDDGLTVPTVQCDAEKLPFPDKSFETGGKALVLEFSKVWEPLRRPYDAFSFGVLPLIGKVVAHDAESYRYLAESIRMHPDQETLAQMFRDAGFGQVRYFNMTAGVVALHQGVRLD